MVKWAEILAAITVAAIFLPVVFGDRPADTSGRTTPYRKGFDYRTLPEVQEKLLNITPYRDYDNLVIRDGRVIGGL